MTDQGKIIKLSEGYYPENQQETLFSCPKDTDVEEIGREINGSIVENEGKFGVNPSGNREKSDADNVLETFGCKRITEDDTIHISNRRRKRTESRWDEESMEMEEKQLRKPELIINGNRFTEGGEQW